MSAYEKNGSNFHREDTISDPRSVALHVENLVKEFDGRRVLDKVTLDIYEGETFVIMGLSGCGKSTLLRHMVGTLSPTAGRVLFKGVDLATVKGWQAEQLKRRFGMSFQSAALIDFMSVYDNVALPLREHTQLDEEIIRMIVEMKLTLVGMQDYAHLMPSALSGGMKKRVGLARAIALDPEVVFYDEPTSGLDPIVSAGIDRLIKDLNEKLLLTSVVVTHNMESVFRIADRVAMLHEGRILEIGTPDAIRASSNPIVQQFIHGRLEGPIDFRHVEKPAGV